VPDFDSSEDELPSSSSSDEDPLSSDDELPLPPLEELLSEPEEEELSEDELSAFFFLAAEVAPVFYRLVVFCSSSLLLLYSLFRCLLDCSELNFLIGGWGRLPSKIWASASVRH
jgi:hypothetical protein